MTSKFKPGQMVMLRGCRVSKNNGKILTLVKFVGTPPYEPKEGVPWGYPGTWWEVDQPTLKFYGRSSPYSSEVNMVPLSDPDLSNDISKEDLIETRDKTLESMSS